MAQLFLIISALLFAVQSFASEFTWPYWSFKSIPFQPPKLEIIKSDETPASGLLFLGPKDSHVDGVLPDGGATAAIYDQEGDLIWKGPSIENANLQVQTLFGKPVLTYWSGTKVNGYGYGTVHILDETYEEIYSITLKGNYITPSGEPQDSYIDLHESKITERNTILVTSYNLTQVDTTSIGGQPDNWALKSEFHEIEVATNKVLFSWSPLDHRRKFPLSAWRSDSQPEPRPPYDPWDVHHINSVNAAASGYVVSLRHSFSAAYVNRDGSIEWNLDGQTGGDFDLCADCRFSWQHHIDVFDETPSGLTLTIFNNDGREGPDKGQPSTGLVLRVDLDTMTVTNKRTLLGPGKHLNADTQGSVQALDGTPDGNMLVGYGSWATVKEFNSKGDVIWTAKFGPDAQIASYRGYKFDWHAAPWYPPTMVATAYKSPTSRKSTHFYVSWNGATDVAKWNFYAQAAPKSPPILIATIPKTGFETQFITEGFLDRVSVEPVHINGTALHRSPVQRTQLHGDWVSPDWDLPTPDDPKDIAATIANSTLNSVPEQAGNKDTPDSDSDSGLDSTEDDEDEESNQLPDYDEENVEVICDTCTEYEMQPWVMYALSFFIVCSLASCILVLMWLSKRHKRAWYEWIPGAKEV